MKNGNRSAGLFNETYSRKGPLHEALIGQAALGSVDGADDDPGVPNVSRQVIEAVHICQELVQLVRQGKLDRDPVEAGEGFFKGLEINAASDGKAHASPRRCQGPRP